MSAHDWVRVRVPGSTSNLGPGFDVLGLALQLYNTLTVERAATDITITAHGEGAEDLTRVEDSLVVKAMRLSFDAWGKQLPGLRIHLDNQVPIARGLGGSSTAIVGGILAAAALCGKELSTSDTLALALPIEGHEGNLSPALLGGLVICVTDDDGQVHSEKIPLALPLRAVLCIPEARLSTKLAREVLPGHVPLADAVFNMRSLALLLTGLTLGRSKLIATGMRDRLHQPYRAKLMPAMQTVVQAALEADALGAALSGAGSSIFAFAEEITASNVGEAMREAMERTGTACRTVIVDTDMDGAQVLDVQ